MKQDHAKDADHEEGMSEDAPPSLAELIAAVRKDLATAFKFRTLDGMRPWLESAYAKVKKAEAVVRGGES